MTNKLFLKWWLMFTVILVATIFIYSLGLFRVVWDQDTSKLSFVILAIFFGKSICCGRESWNVSDAVDKDDIDEDDYHDLKRAEDAGWFYSDMCLTLGMIGTVYGFILMFFGFDKIDPSNAANIQQMLKSMSSGISTALYTTLVGLICGLLLKMQYFNMAQGLDELKEYQEVTGEAS